MKKKIYTFLAVVQVFLLLLAPHTTYALFGIGGSIGGKVRSGIKNFLTKDLLIDDNDLAVGQEVRKVIAPEVTITFTKIDEKHYKAIALVKGVNNPREAYYTWYIRNSKNPNARGFEPAGSLPAADTIGTLGISPNNVEFWKIMATREIIKNHFDPMRYDSTFNGGNGNGVLEASEYASDIDDDGYVSELGGGNAKGADDYCYLYDRKTGEIFEMMEGGSVSGGIECPDGFEPACVYDDRLSCPNPADGGATTTLFDACSDSGSAPICGSTGPTCTDGEPMCVPFTESFSLADNSKCPMAGEPNPLSCVQASTNGIIVPPLPTSCQNSVFSAGGALNNYCDEEIHMFPFAPGASLAGFNFVTGDGSFNNEEEMFWGTDPENDNTVPGYLDEELIVGRGLKEFVWEYQEGDEVGVVVEGDGNMTRHEDRSTQTVFAFMPDGCEIDDNDKAWYFENIRGKNVKIPTVDMDKDDLNECLRENLTQPGGKKEELELDVRIEGPEDKLIPKDPEKSISFKGIVTNKGDDLGVETTIGNTDFEWVIEHSLTKRSSDFVVVDKDTLKNSLGITTRRGLGFDELEMKQNFPNDWFANHTDMSAEMIEDSGWIRVKLRANAPSSRADVTRFGQAIYLFQITRPNDSMNLDLNVGEPTGSNDGYTSGTPICTDPDKKMNCEVLINQVIRIALPSNITARNTVWTVNGKSVYCNEFIAPECTETTNARGMVSNSSVIYVPIVKDVDTYNIVATVSELGTVEATNRRGLPTDHIKSTVKLRAKLVKIDPRITLSPTSGATRLIRGDFVDLDGTSRQEASDNLFQAPRGSQVGIKADFIPPFLSIGSGEAKIEWYVNSVQFDDTDNEITFTSERNVTVTANGYYDITNNKRATLKNVFNIDSVISGRKFFSESATVEMIDEPIAKAPSNKIFATVSQNFSEYFVFLLKLMFMIAILLVVPKFILGLSFGGRRYRD